MRDVMTKCCEIVFRVKILWTHQLMMAGRVMLGVIIGFHFASFVPINIELSLCGLVAYPGSIVSVWRILWAARFWDDILSGSSGV